jgi:diacylglycerol kinase (ATP)
MQVIVLLSCAVTLAAEMFNTAIEELSDALVQEHHPGIAKTKELAASAVLLLSIATLLITIYSLFNPY